MLSKAKSHLRTVGALMMREIMTRYGREGMGFLWLIGEPLLFCGGVLIMWSIIKPPYEHGVRLGPFVMSGYMSLLLIRHLISYCVSAVSANSGLLYHSRISQLHIYGSRIVLEFVGATLAFVVVYIILLLLGQLGPPTDYLLLYSGWLIVFGLGTGLAMVFAGLVVMYETFERIVGFLSYALIPLSGAFMMTSFLPPEARPAYMLIPFPHGVEMIRSSIFGEFVETYYNVPYALLWILILNGVGLVLVTLSEKHIEVD